MEAREMEQTGGWYAPKERSAAHYDQREYEGTDLTRLEELLDQLETSCQEEQASQISDLYDQILKEMDWLATQTALADILYSAALDDEQLSDQYEEASQNAQEAMEMILSSFQNAMKMPGGEALEEAMGPEIAWAVETYEPATERLSSLLDQEMELMLQYNQVRAQPLTVEVEGEEWDYQTLDEADIDYAEYSRIYGELAKENNRRLGEIYLELVQVREVLELDSYDWDSGYEAQTQPSDSRFAGIVVLAAAAVLEMQAVCFAIGGVILWQIVKKRPSVTSGDDRQASGPPPGHSS